MHIRSVGLTGLLFLALWAKPALADLQTEQHSLERTKSAECLELLRRPERQEARRNFIEAYAEMQFTTEAENTAWIESSLTAPQGERFYVVMENAELKRLNDEILKDKDLVTALTHLQKELFLNQISEDFPDLRFQLYSDFKSVRLEVFGSIDSSSFERFKLSFQLANRKLQNQAAVREILRETDLAQAPSWFALGLGDSADQASLAARGARLSPSRAKLFAETDFQHQMRQKLETLQGVYEELITNLSQTQLVEKAALKLQVYVLARKAGTPEKLLHELLLEYPGTNLNLATAHKIKSLTLLADEFSPSMLIGKRETLTLHEASYGALSLDFIGLGGENLKATAEALAQAQDLTAALELTRLSERAVTQSFIQRKQQVTEIVKEYFAHRVSIKFSGDDGIIIPHREFWLRDQLALLRQLSALSPEPYFRMSTLHQRVSQAEDSAQFISHAEGIEKLLRPLIRQHMGSEINHQISINAFISGENFNRDVHLVLSAGMDFKRSERALLIELFQKAVKSFEHNLRAQGENLSFEAVEAYAITPSTPKAY